MKVINFSAAIIIPALVFLASCSRTTEIDVQNASALYQADAALDDRDAFKFTVTTDSSKINESQFYTDPNEEKVAFMVQVNKVDEGDIILYDLDCEGDGNYEFTGLTESHDCIYSRDTWEHQIWVRGSIPSLVLCQTDPPPQRGKFGINPLPKQSPVAVISIDNWGSIAWKSMKSFAAGCQYLEHIPSDAPDLGHVEDMSSMFSYAIKFNDRLEHWDVSNVKNMSKMFAGTEMFDQPLEHWDVSNVKDMSEMFAGTGAFNHPLEHWDVSNVEDMSEMFAGSKLFNQPLEKWNVSNVKTMKALFFHSDAFNQPLEKWNVSNVRDMGSMFEMTTSFNQPLEGWNVSNVTSMKAMFYASRSFNQPLEKWNVSNVTDMSSMFGWTEAFNQPLEKWDMSNVEDLRQMFERAQAFNQPLEKWVFKKARLFGGMFRESMVFNQPLEGWDMSHATNLDHMFEFAMAFNQPLNGWNVYNVRNMKAMFRGSNAFNQPLDRWDVSNVEDFQEMFAGSRQFDHAISTWHIQPYAQTGGMLNMLSKNKLIIGHLGMAPEEAKNKNIFKDRKPFKFTITTNKKDLIYSDAERKYAGHPDNPFFKDNKKDGGDSELDELFGEDEITDDGLMPIIIHVNPVNDLNVIYYDLDCDGDGKYEHLGLTDNYICKFKANSGKYQIRIRGEVPSLLLCTNQCPEYGIDCRFNYDDNRKKQFPIDTDKYIEYTESTNYRAVISIDDWGDIDWKSMHYFAAECERLNRIPKKVPNLTHVNDMSAMFYKSGFNRPIGHWDVSHVVTMEGMFENAESFNQPLEKWDVSNVKDMREMFMNAKSFNQSLENWKISKESKMDSAFRGCPYSPSWTVDRQSDGSR